MGPARKSRSLKRSYGSEASPSKEADGAKRSNSRKRKLTDMLGPRWTTEELTRFYDSYRKNGKDWKKVANGVRNRSSEMVEALYTMNRAYLSLPHGTASAAGLIAMMTDHYSNLAGSDSEDDSNDGAGSSRKAKRARGKVQATTSKALDEQFDSQASTLISTYGCLPLLKKKRTGGSRPRPVGKRTPRFPVSFSYEKSYLDSPTKQGLDLKDDTNDDEVHEIAAALAGASQRGGSPQVSGTPSRRVESVMSSPYRHTHTKDSASEIAKAKCLVDMDEEDLEGSTEADTGELSRHNSYMVESVNRSVKRVKGRNLEGEKLEVESNDGNHLDDIKEECSGTNEGQRLGATKNNDTKISSPPIQSQRKKGKKVLFRRDEDPAFDALQTLADLSLMILPSEIEEESKVQFKDEHHDHVDESAPSEILPAKREKRKPSGVRMKGHQISNLEAAPSKASKSGKGSGSYATSIPEENQASHQPTTKTSRRKQKMPVSKIEKTESNPAIHDSGPLGIEVGDAGKKLITKNKKSSQSSPPNLIRETSSSTDLLKEGSDLSDIQVSTVNQANTPTKVRSKRKIGLKPKIQKDLKFPETILNDQNNMPFGSLVGSVFKFKEKLSNGLVNQRLRRWCTYEWFYSAIDYPWFAKREFVEYLYHVGLGHVPRLTRVEWGVIRSSLGKPRRFSEQFLKEENEKLNQYRESVREHYTELRNGVREGLPTDLAKPLSVGQRVIAIHPRTREIHDGSVLTVDHSKCRVQFDRHDLGVEFVMDIDCMPLNPFENMPALLGRLTVGVDKFFENFNDLKVNGQTKEHIKLPPGENLDIINAAPQISTLANPATLLKQIKGASANANIQTNILSVDAATFQQMAYSQAAGLQAKEADVQALSELTRALDKKEAIVLELRRMNDDVVEDQKNSENVLKESENFRKHYAAVLVQLNDANEQVASAIHCLRERNTYEGKCQLTVPRPVSSFADTGVIVNPLEGSIYQTHEVGSHVNDIMDSSRLRAQTMVDAAMQAIASLKSREDTIDKIEEAIDYVNDQLPSCSSLLPVASDPKPTNALDMEAQIPSELITKCVATLLMIQKCTERQFPPSDVAKILDSAVTSLHPRSSQNLPVYTEIQKCVGIIKNQILALIPT